MQYITGIDSHQWNSRTAVTLGKFDGLHRGHMRLVEQIRRYSSDSCRSVVCAFDMHRPSLMTREERREHLEGKVDCLVDYPFTEQLKAMEAENFIRNILYERLHAAHVVVGMDFCFGHGKKGNAQMLRAFGDTYGFTVDVVEKERYKDRVISSTYIKEALEQGDVFLAEKLLGYPYELSGMVEHGRQLGRTLGFPTMNLAPSEKKILPTFGVYTCRAEIDGKWYNGIGNVGIKPTVTEEHRRLVEVYVYGYKGNAYGKHVKVCFLSFIRPEMRFASVEELKNRVLSDMQHGENYFAEKFL